MVGKEHRPLLLQSSLRWSEPAGALFCRGAHTRSQLPQRKCILVHTATLKEYILGIKARSWNEGRQTFASNYSHCRSKSKKTTFQVGFRERLLPGQVLLSSDLKEHI